MKPEEMGIHIMTAVFNGVIGAAFIIYGFIATFHDTWIGWGAIGVGLWLLFTCKIIWELIDFLEKK